MMPMGRPLVEPCATINVETGTCDSIRKRGTLDRAEGLLQIRS